MREDLLPANNDGKIGRLVEECGEVLQAVGKLVRFGARPIDQKTGVQYDNIADLRRELRDLRHAIDAVEKMTETL